MAEPIVQQVPRRHPCAVEDLDLAVSHRFESAAGPRLVDVVVGEKNVEVVVSPGR